MRSLSAWLYRMSTGRVTDAALFPFVVSAVPPAAELLRAAGASAVRSMIDPLSERELQVLRLLAEGASNQEIAAGLVVSNNTVKTHGRTVYQKLGASLRAQAAARAREPIMPWPRGRPITHLRVVAHPNLPPAITRAFILTGDVTRLWPAILTP